jgi:ATP-dependent RNA helicase HelY
VGPAVVRRFRSITAVLKELGYLDGWSLTVHGDRLRTIYNQMDLVLAEALRRGVFDGLDGPQVAAVASAFTYEPRREAGADTWPPDLDGAAGRLHDVWEAIVAVERHHGLDASRSPEPGFARTAAQWASGVALERIFEHDEEAAVGDFVRNARQLIDLLRQISDTGQVEPSVVAAAIDGVDRGVVAAAGAL